MPADKYQLVSLNEALNKYSLSTGLNISYEKLSMIPINVPEGEISELVEAFGC